MPRSRPNHSWNGGPSSTPKRPRRTEGGAPPQNSATLVTPRLAITLHHIATKSQPPHHHHITASTALLTPTPSAHVTGKQLFQLELVKSLEDGDKAPAAAGAKAGEGGGEVFFYNESLYDDLDPDDDDEDD